jgi:hypothetical protein
MRLCKCSAVRTSLARALASFRQNLAPDFGAAAVAAQAQLVGGGL